MLRSRLSSRIGHGQASPGDCLRHLTTALPTPSRVQARGEEKLSHSHRGIIARLAAKCAPAWEEADQREFVERTVRLGALLLEEGSHFLVGATTL